MSVNTFDDNCSCEVKIRTHSNYIEQYDYTKNTWERFYPNFRVYQKKDSSAIGEWQNNYIVIFASDGKKIVINQGCELDYNGQKTSDFNEINQLLQGLIVNFNTGGGGHGNWVFVEDLTAFAEDENEDLILASNYTYVIANPNLDLLGKAFTYQGKVTIIGGSSETSKVTSTGLDSGKALLKGTGTIAINFITFSDVDTCLDISKDTDVVALDWLAVNFENIPNVGTIVDADNWVFTKGAFLQSQGLSFDGTSATITASESFFGGTGLAGNIFKFEDTLTVTRRIRFNECSFFAQAPTNALNLSVAATIPVEGYILKFLNFSGGTVANYIVGVQHDDNKSRFVECKGEGIRNSASVAGFYMRNNLTVTSIPAQDTPVKVAGTTTATAINQRFNHTNNRLTYTGKIPRDFFISVVSSFESGNNQRIGLYIAKNGVPVPETEMYATTDGNNRAEGIPIQGIIMLKENDFIEIWVENSSISADDITVGFLNVAARALN